MFAETVWDDTMLLGLDSLDTQHKAIFDAVAEIGQAIRQARHELLETLLGELRKRLAEHFAYEEGLGLCSEEHRHTHRLVMVCVDDNIDALGAGAAVSEGELHSALCVQLVKDLIHHDAELVGALLKGGHIQQR